MRLSWMTERLRRIEHVLLPKNVQEQGQKFYAERPSCFL